MGLKIYIVADFCQYLIVTTNEAKARNVVTEYDDWRESETDFITLDTWQDDTCIHRETFMSDGSTLSFSFITDLMFRPTNFADGRKQAS